MKQTVPPPLVKCSRCPNRWPLGGAIDEVHPVSGASLPNHPLLLVQSDGQVVCSACMLRQGLSAVALTAEKYEALQKRQTKGSPVIRAVREPSRPRASDPIVRGRPATPYGAAPVVRRDAAPGIPWQPNPASRTPINPVLTASLSQRIQEDMRQAAQVAQARRDALVNAELEREAHSPWRAGKRSSGVPVTKGRMARAFPRPAIGSHWPTPDPTPFEIVSAGTATSAFVPEDVIAQVLGASEDTALELRVKGLTVVDKKRSARG